MGDVTVPVWVAVASAIVTVLGGALLGVYFRFKRGLISVRSAQTDLDIRITDHAVAYWKNAAEEANKRADEQTKEFDRRLEAVIARANEREHDLVTQHQDRELQFGSIIDRIRSEYDTKIDLVTGKHEECLRNNAVMEGRIIQLETQVKDLQNRVEAQSARRKVGGQRIDDPPEGKRDA